MAVEITQELNTAPAGVPIGGIGTGCIELGLDGRLRNITINNNRTSDTRIPVSGGSFLAVRAARRGKVITRVLQASSEVPFEQAGVVPPFATEEQLTWRGLYPAARYHLNDARFPLEVKWRAFAPIIPYDLDSSTLPVLYLSLDITNLTHDVYDASVVFNWENLNGCVNGLFPEDRGPITPIPLNSLSPQGARPAQEDSRDARQLSYIGLEFGGTEEPQSNAHGHYCLIAQPHREAEVTVRSWNERDPSAVADFWQSFYYEGNAGNEFTPDPAAHSGAVCCSTELGPKSSHHLVFVLTWYCPRFEVDGVDYGNAYTNAYRDAVAVAVRGLKYYSYYANAVEAWQRRILSSSLPPWFSRMLVNNNYVFSTNTFLAKDGRFAMMETPADPLMGSVDRRFHSSLGALLLFPELEHREMAQLGRAQDPDAPGRIYRHLGRLGIDSPGYGNLPDELIDVNPKFVLMAYRNFYMTGRRAAIGQLYPRLKEAMEYMLTKDEDKDGLPEQYGISTTFDNYPIFGINSYTSSLWIVAMRAFARLARKLGFPEDARPYEALIPKAIERFEQCLWIEEKGYYRLFCDNEKTSNREDAREDGCHTGQLAGQWYADFLCLGHLFPDSHIQKALDAMWQMTEAPYRERAKVKKSSAERRIKTEKRPELSWPAFYATHCACLHIHQGDPNRGFYCLSNIHHDIHAEGGRAFNQPLAWDRANARAVGWGSDRHMGSTSVWHVLYALEGFYLDVPDKSLWIRPNLPKNVNSLRAPLFTPVCLGSLEYQQEFGDRYRQRVRIAFDSPLHIKRMVLRIPRNVVDVNVHFVSPAGVEKTEHVVGMDGDERLVEIILPTTVMMGGPTTVTLEEAPPPPPEISRT
ncbi:MAG: GH116 family glycosyl-hydrolase [FCB group bacterium]|jgi:uncharacterized protein (DUF608 family)|nr:GH116 family glycosyl-hydrolase [FCB group bacterium]